MHVVIFSSAEPNVQDELLWSLPVRRLSVRRLSTPFNDFSSKTPGPIFFKLYVALSVKGGLKIYTDCHGPLSEIAAIPIWYKHF